MSPTAADTSRRRKWMGWLLGLAFLGLLVTVTLQQARVTCEVCMGYRGRELCDTATARDRDEALLQARTSVCSRLSSGVTDGIRCNGTPPLSVTCSD